LLEPYIEANLHDVTAWLWEAETWPSVEAKIKVLEMCLLHNPDNQQVSQALTALNAQKAGTKMPDQRFFLDSISKRWLWLFLTAILGELIIIVLVVFGELSFQQLKNKGWTPYDLHTDTSSVVLDIALVPSAPGELKTEVRSMVLDEQGRMWLGTVHGVVVCAPDGSQTIYSMANSGLVGELVEVIALDKQGRAWMGTIHGLSVLAPDGSWTTYTPANSGLTNEVVEAIAFDEQGRAWIGTLYGLSVLSLDGSWTTYTPENSGLISSNIMALAVDQHSRVWVGTDSGLSVLSPDGTWATPINTGGEMVGKNVIDIDRHNQIWVGIYSNIGQDRLMVFSSDGSPTTINQFAGEQVFTLAIDGQDRMWAGYNRGLIVLNPDGKWTKYATYNSGLAHYAVRKLAFDRQGRLWVVTPEGLNIFDERMSTPVQEMDELIKLRPNIIRLELRVMMLLAVVLLMGKKGLRALNANPVYEVDRKDVKDFAIGFFIWFALNTVLILWAQLAPQLTHCKDFGCLGIMVEWICLTALSNLVALIFLLRRRQRWMLFGVLAVDAMVVVQFFLPFFTHFLGFDLMW
jgi:sugar lactone lactonase YvrE